VAPWAKWVTAALAAITLLLLFLSSFKTVGTQNVGIVTSFGKPVGALSNGAHLVAPWDKVTAMSNQVETDLYEGNCDPANPNGGIPVRIADQQTACAQVRIVWQMRKPAADGLFRQYQNPGNVRVKLVKSELLTAMNEQFDGYDPVGSLTSKYRLGSPQNPTVPQVALAVTRQMQREIGGRVKVTAVLVPIITYDEAVQTQLNSLLKQKAATDVAIEAERTAAAQSAAAADLAHGNNLSPAVLTQNCYNIVTEAMKTGYSLPATFNCQGGGNASVLVGH